MINHHVVTYEIGKEVDFSGKTDAQVAYEAIGASEAMTDNTRLLMGYYEREIKRLTQSQIDTSIYGRFKMDSFTVLHPEFKLFDSCDIPYVRYDGPKRVVEEDIPLCRLFLTGLCRYHFKERGMMVIINDLPKTTMDVLFTYGFNIQVSIINTNIRYKHVIQQDSSTPQPILFSPDVPPVSVFRAHLITPSSLMAEPMGERSSPMLGGMGERSSPILPDISTSLPVTLINEESSDKPVDKPTGKPPVEEESLLFDKR